MEEMITRNVLDCDQSNYSSRIIFAHRFTIESKRIGSDEPFQRYRHSKLCKTADGRDLGFGPADVGPFDPPTRKPYHRTKREVICMTRCRNMAIRHFPRWRPAAILDLLQPEVAPFDPPTWKAYHRTKHEVDRMIHCRDIAIRNFPKCEVGQ